MSKIRSSFLRFLSKFWQLVRRRWKLILIVTLIVTGIGWWQYNRTQANKPELTFEHPIREDLVQTLDVSGVVDAKEKAQMRFIAGGKITYIGAHEGDWVEKWQTIATIDQATLEKQLQQDLNNYMKERWDWEGSQDQYNYNLEPLEVRRTLDKEQWDLENSVLNVEIRDIAIRNTTLSAPFAGVLTAAPTNVAGTQVLSSDYFELVNPDTLVFRAAVDEADISKVQIGQKAEIELDAYLDEFVPSGVDYVAYTSSQSTSGTVFIVEFPIMSDDLARFRIGMNGDVTIQTGISYNALTIPIETITERDGNVYVQVRTSEEETEEREIELGLEAEDRVEVMSGLSESDEILIP